jgi:hypothetical protein
MIFGWAPARILGLLDPMLLQYARRAACATETSP